MMHRAREMAEPITSSDQDKLSPAKDSPILRDLELIAKAEINRRRQRYRFFSKDLFGEPSWDILLEVYIAHAAGQEISVSNTCIAANVPATTGLRYLNSLVAKGLLRCRKSDEDRRVSFVSLTDNGLFLMEQYLQSQLSAFKFD